MNSKLGLLLICALVGASAKVVASESNVFFSCSITDEWFSLIIAASRNDPPPTREELKSFATESGLYQIDLSFDPNRLSSGFGFGQLMNESVPYWITEEHIIFMTASEDGSENSFLSRYTGSFSLNLMPNMPILYDCERRERKY